MRWRELHHLGRWLWRDQRSVRAQSDRDVGDKHAAAIATHPLSALEAHQPRNRNLAIRLTMQVTPRTTRGFGSDAGRTLGRLLRVSSH
jgi:hypothetical protein